ncbi:MAG: SHOCT domain-containing protein [Thermomicrobiales bacterium]|nr:SHOCT domain-containing protein [Thermomicrobiales bacterium]
MIRRRPAARSGPSLVGTMARTAVIAGTATAVSGNVAARGAQRAQAQQQQNAAQQAAINTQVEVEQMRQQIDSLQAQQVQAAAEPAAAPAAGGADMIAQLQQLGELRTAGILNDAEFEAAKARILAG